MQRSYLNTTKQLREMMTARSPSMKINSTVLLTNNQGFAQLSTNPNHTKISLAGFDTFIVTSIRLHSVYSLYVELLVFIIHCP